MTTPREDEQKLMAAARAMRAKALTPEQRELVRKTDERNALIQAGVKQPASGIFGKPKP